MIQSNIFTGRKICGFRTKSKAGEKGYLGQVEPDSKTGQCPRDYFKCGSLNKDINYQSCIPDSSVLKMKLDSEEYAEYMDKRCPINGIKFVSRSREKNEKGFTYIEFNAEYDLAFSKSQSNRPFTTFNVGE